MQRSDLTKLELYQEDGCYYLRAEYEVEDDHRLQKYTIPKISLPIRREPVINEDVLDYPIPRYHSTISLGFAELEILKGDDGYLYKCETIKEYPQKMTLEEIEKKLGYKVEVVSGK